MNIKERVLHIAEKKNIVKTEFFKELGLSYANFKGVQKSSALNSDAIATILAKYPDVSPTWLVTGEGEMLSEQKTAPITKTETKDKSEDTEAIIAALNQVILSQEKTIQSQGLTITSLQEQIIQKKKKSKKKKGKKK